MYIIIMDSDKQLIPTIRQAIYRGENMMDDVKFLLPLTYKKFDLSEFTVVLQYIQNNKIVHEETLTMDNPPLRNDRLSFSLQLNSIFTKKEGKLKIQLRVTKIDTEASVQYILKTSDCCIDILPSYYYETGDESEAEIGSKLEEIGSKLEVMDSVLATKADNISLDSENGEIVLSSSGSKIGDSISAKDLGNTIVEHTTDGLVNILI